MGERARAVVRALWVGLAYGVGVGLLFYGLRLGSVLQVMSVGFLLLLPFALGFQVVWLAERRGKLDPLGWLLLPWLPSVLCLGAAFLAAMEGAICIIIWVPLFLLCASVGGGAAALLRHARTQPPRLPVLASVAILPFVAAPIEQAMPVPAEFTTVATQIDIAATPEHIWPFIARVAAIQSDELPASWVYRVGFPRPIEATLSREAVGGVRHATFEGGVLFVETIDRWEPQRRLAFSIHADPDSIPMRTLDQHVTVGGPYFDVLRGEYRIESLGPGRCRLHLTSRHRLSTRVNPYARLWTRAIMREIQENILAVIRRRCERPRGLNDTPVI